MGEVEPTMFTSVWGTIVSLFMVTSMQLGTYFSNSLLSSSCSLKKQKSYKMFPRRESFYTVRIV